MLSGARVRPVAGDDRLSQNDPNLAADAFAKARTLQAQLDMVLDTALEAIVSLREDGTIVRFNRAAEQLWGWSAEEITGKHVGLLLKDGWTDRYARGYQRALETQLSPVVLEMESVHKDGTPVTVEGTRTHLEVAGEILVTGFWRDITDRKASAEALIEAKENAEAANRAKSEFLAAMSHEIRTPLNGVLGMAAALETTPLTDLQRRMIGVINESGHTLMTLLSDILDLSKIEAGRMEFESTPFELTGAAEAVASLFTETAKAKGLKFDLVIGEGAKGVFLGDPTRIRQVLQNLVSNATKFTKTGGVQLRLDGAALEDGRRELTVEIIDTGVGIAEDARARLFSKFVQADSSTSRHFGGTGLGLAICRELVTAMGGAIGVDSELGKGSRFWFRLPLSLAETASPGAPQAVEAAEDSVRTIRILAAEDNATNQFVLKAILGQNGLEATFVENGRLAVEAVQAEDFDLILMDLHMPEMDGLSATQAIRALGGSKSQIPVIAVTAEAMPEQVRKCLAAGMDAHVAKPIRPDVLYGVIEDVLTRGRSARLSA
jgi:PAS domain S-box-containing protein